MIFFAMPWWALHLQLYCICEAQQSVEGWKTLPDENPHSWPRKAWSQTMDQALLGLSVPLSLARQPQTPIVSKYLDATLWQFNWAFKNQSKIWIIAFHFWVSLDLHKWSGVDRLSQIFELIHADLKKWLI